MDTEKRETKIRRRYIFTGRVQGVGFRYRAENAAQRYDVTGFVENLYDGSVLLEAEGREEDIDRAVMQTLQGMFIEVENMTVKEIPPEGGYGFTAR